MKLGSPEAMRQEPSNHEWERQEAERDVAIEKEEAAQEEERQWWEASACCGAPLSDETSICSSCHDYSLSRSAEADMRQAKEEYDAKKTEQEECPHDEHDHGICLDCGLDIMDDLVAAAEFNADCREDR